ncbi:MAG TPA: fibronectin type III domain-containing protein [Jatrophihabitantaceae bacterium]
MEAARSGRRSVAAWTCGCLAVLVGLASTGTLGTAPAEAMRQAGHWVYNGSVGQVVHVNGGSKHVDSAVRVAGVGSANEVTQDDQHGYVIDQRNGRVIVFGKSSLKVESTLSLGTGEQPVVLETLGGPYLVYGQGGTIVRLGSPAATIRAGGRLASAIATTDGTVWVQRGADRLCRLGRGQGALTCSVSVPAGHKGALAAVDDRPVYLDRTAGTVAPVDTGGVGHPVSVGAPDALNAGQLANTDAGGRLPLVVAGRPGRASSLVLVDASTVGSGRTPAAPITVPLGSDQYDPPVTTGGAVVVVDRTAHDVITFDNRGRRTAAVHAPSTGPLRASRGEDGRVYVDTSDGSTSYVVDGDGTVTAVDNNDGTPGPARRDDGNGNGNGNAPRPTTTPTATPHPTPPPPVTRPPSEPPAPPAGPRVPPPSTVPSDPPPADTPPSNPPPSDTPPSTPPPEVPDAPATVNASAAAGHLDVSWFVPGDNGSPITGYTITWSCSGGSCTGHRDVGPGARSAQISTAIGLRYVVSVAARNAVGLGPATSSASTAAKPPAPGPLNSQATAAADGSVTVTWAAEPGQWSFTVTTSGGQRVATTGGTRAVISGRPLGTRVGFTVRGTEAQGGTVSDSTGTVVPYTPASAPTALAGSVVGANAGVNLTWAAPGNLGGGRLTGYRVTVTGGTTKTVTGTSTTVPADADGDTDVQVVALTTDPNAGGALQSPAASRTVHYSGPPPDVALNNGEIDGGNLVIDYELNSHGLASTCKLTVDSDSALIWSGTLADGNHRGINVGPFQVNGDTKIRLTCSTSAGSGTDPTVVPG